MLVNDDPPKWAFLAPTLHLDGSGSVVFDRSSGGDNQTASTGCTFNSAELKAMNLRPGVNSALVLVPDLNVEVPLNIHLLSQVSVLLGTTTTTRVTDSNLLYSMAINAY